MRGLGNLLLLMLVVLAAVVLFFFACPWFDQIGHKGVCYVGYGILIVVLLYARAGATRQRRAR